MIKIEDKNDDNMFKFLKINSKFKICWGQACLILDGVSLFNVIRFSPISIKILNTVIPHDEELNLSILSQISLQR